MHDESVVWGEGDEKALSAGVTDYVIVDHVSEFEGQAEEVGFWRGHGSGRGHQRGRQYWRGRWYWRGRYPTERKHSEDTIHWVEEGPKILFHVDQRERETAQLCKTR